MRAAAAEPPSPDSSSDDRAALLRSDSNPDGWDLDALLARIRAEFELQLRAMDTRNPQVRAQRLGYDRVIVALWEAEGRYRVLGSPRNWV